MEHLLHGITHPVVCEACHDEFVAGLSDSRSLQDYVRVDLGFTEMGLQVWCRRHDANVVHVDFAGNRLNADFLSVRRTPDATL